MLSINPLLIQESNKLIMVMWSRDFEEQDFSWKLLELVVHIRLCIESNTRLSV